MPGITIPVGPSALLASTSSLTGATPGAPSLAAFIDLMVGQVAPAPIKAGPGMTDRQDDAATGNALPSDGDDTTPDPALAWMLVAPPVVTPLPVPPPAPVPGGTSKAPIIEATQAAAASASPTVPTISDTAPVATDATPDPIPADTTRSAAPKPTLTPLEVIEQPPIILVPGPTARDAAPIAPHKPSIWIKAPPPVATPVDPSVPVTTPAVAPTAPVASQPVTPATPPVVPAPADTATPATATTPAATAPALTPLSVIDTPPAILVVDTTVAPTAAPAPVIAPTAQPAAPIRFELPRQSAPRLVVQAPTSAQQGRAAAPVVQPALFALAGLAERNALDRDDRATSPVTDAISQIQAAASHTVAAAADAQQQQTLDMGRHDWPQKMIDHIDALRDQANANDTSIRLKPEALGRVDVSLRTHDNGAISVRFTAEQPTTRTMLADAAPQLAQVAEARGIRLSGTSVDLAGSGQGDQRPRPEIERQQSTTNHFAVPNGDDTDAVADGRIA